MMELNEETPKDVAADEESSEDEDGIVFTVAETGEDEDGIVFNIAETGEDEDGIVFNVAETGEDGIVFNVAETGEDEDGIVFNVAETGEDENERSAKAEVAINSILTDKDETEEPPREDEEEEDDSVHIVVFGKDGTGKSALIVRLLTRRFIHEYDPTSEDVYAHHCIVDGDSVVMKLLDTAGMIERNVHEREEQIRWGDGYLLVLSLTCPESIPELHMIKALIDQVDEEAKPKVVVANKRDLLHARQVMSSEVQQLGKEWDCPVFEVAATEEYTVVKEPFFSLCREIIKRRKVGRRIPSVTKLHKELVLADAHKRCEVKRPLNDNGLQFQELCDGEDVQFSS